MLARRVLASRNFTSILLSIRRTISSSYLYNEDKSHFIQDSKVAFQQLFSEDIVENYTFFSVHPDGTLEALSDFFDSLADAYELPDPEEYDVNFGDGVLTVHFGGNVGTYVINKQTPNQQIWLSSPSSGPKRYDYVNNTWIYKRENTSLHQLLSSELSLITGESVDLTDLLHGGKTG